MLSLGAILVATLAPGNAIAVHRLPPAWCLRCGDTFLTDLVSNVVLFVPFGLAWQLWRPDAPFPRWGPLLGLLVSLGVESLQALGIPPQRNPSLADLLTNTAGATLGASLPWLARTLRSSSARTSAQLSVVWSVAATAVFLLSSLAQQPLPSTREVAGTTPSRFSYAPGFGWYQGRVDSARVNAVRITRGQPGPVVREADAPGRRADLHLWFDGNEPLADRKPALFVHLPGDTTILYALGKHGSALEFVAARRGDRWGLAMPPAYIRGVFSAERRAARGGDAVAVDAQAVADTDALHLRVRDGSRTDSATLTYSPGQAWAFLQTLAHPFGPLAIPIMVTWFAVLVGPAAWTAARARRGLAVPLLLVAPGGWWTASWYTAIGRLPSEAAALLFVMTVAFVSSRWAHRRSAGTST